MWRSLYQKTAPNRLHGVAPNFGAGVLRDFSDVRGFWTPLSAERASGQKSIHHHPPTGSVCPSVSRGVRQYVSRNYRNHEVLKSEGYNVTWCDTAVDITTWAHYYCSYNTRLDYHRSKVITLSLPPRHLSLISFDPAQSISLALLVFAHHRVCSML